MAERLAILIATTVELSSSFENALSSAEEQPAAEPEQSRSSSTEKSNNNDEKEALSLLSTASSALKVQVTKLSLFAINNPFTPSTLNTVLSPVNDSVLPTLVTAALLVKPHSYTKAFHSEAQILTRNVLRDLAKLVLDIRGIAEKKEKERGKEEEDLSQSEKDAVTIGTGHVWDSCDALIGLADNGIMGFVARRVDEWRNLVRDAIEEIQDWDPEEAGEEDDFFFGDCLDDDGDGVDGGERGRDREGDEPTDIAALHEQKKSTIRVLKPISQVFTAIAANRLRNQSPISSGSDLSTLEALMLHLEGITGDVDEAAGALYDGSLENSSRYLKKAKNRAMDAIDLVVMPWHREDVDGEQTLGDKFTIWSRTWVNVVNEVIRSMDMKQ